MALINVLGGYIMSEDNKEKILDNAVDAFDSDEEKSAEELYNEGAVKKIITKNEIVGDIIAKYPGAAMILVQDGMFCITCGAAQMESLEEACMVHGLDPDSVELDVNDYLTRTLEDALKEEAAKEDAE